MHSHQSANSAITPHLSEISYLIQADEMADECQYPNRNVHNPIGRDIPRGQFERSAYEIAIQPLICVALPRVKNDELFHGAITKCRP
jgi:hypothetical protein